MHIAGGAALLTWRYMRRGSAKIDISWPSINDQRQAALAALSLLEQARAFNPENQRRLILQLMKLGYLPDVTEFWLRPENFIALLDLTARRAAPPTS